MGASLPPKEANLFKLIVVRSRFLSRFLFLPVLCIREFVCTIVVPNLIALLVLWENPNLLYSDWWLKHREVLVLFCLLHVFGFVTEWINEFVLFR